MTLAVIPTLPTVNLSDDEARLIGALHQKLSAAIPALRLRDAYYNGEQVMADLGISIPPELRDLRTVVGWPRLAVEPLHERLDVEGFRYPDSDEADAGMWEVWQANNLDEEGPLGFLDALVFRCAYIVAGSPDEGSAVPLVTFESPLNMTAIWNPRRRAVQSAFQAYTVDDQDFAALLMPEQTVELAREPRGWVVVNRDQHRLGWVPVMPMVNRGRTHDRDGASEITPELMTLTDAGCRAMLRMEIGAEFYSTPQRYILGATEQAFQDSQGNPKSAWETYIGRVLALERDEEGNVPEVGQFTAHDPATHKATIQLLAEQVAAITGLPPSYLGFTTDNPASADSIRMTTDRLVQKAKRKQRSFEGALEGAMRAAMAFRTGVIPDMAQMIETIWRRPEIPTPAATTDAVAKQIDAGYLPPTSDVAGETLGYSPLQRRRIERERRRFQADQAAATLVQRAQASRQPGVPGRPPERASGDQQREPAPS